MADAAPAAAPEQSKSALKKAEKAARMAAEKSAKAAKQAKQATLAVGQGKKTDDIIGIVAKKEEDFPTWYQEVVLKAEMIEYYNEVRACCILTCVPRNKSLQGLSSRSLVSSSCALQACTSGTSFASGSRKRLRQWVSKRPASPCSCRPSLSRRRRVSRVTASNYAMRILTPLFRSRRRLRS